MRLFKVYSLNFKRPFITNVIDQDSTVSIVIGKGPGDRRIIFLFRGREKDYSLSKVLRRSLELSQPSALLVQLPFLGGKVTVE
jgi:hypothetical protein